MRGFVIHIFLTAGIFISSCNSLRKAANADNPIPVIFETDMGNDIDDALALDMLYKYADQGRIKLLALSTNKNHLSSASYLDVMNNWYGYPNIPVGAVVGGANSETGSVPYTEVLTNYLPAFKRTVSNNANYAESVALYRRILSVAADYSVVIISVGFSTNLARLLDSAPDQYSHLAGKELVARKVKLLSVMAGNFKDQSFKEYNVIKDIPAAQQLFELWPTQIVVSPFELGDQIKYPASSIRNDFNWTSHHPMVIAYKSYAKMPYDRQTWDLTSVLYAVEGAKHFFSLSEKGTIEVTNGGITFFAPNRDGRHCYLRVNDEQAARIKKRFMELITTKPLSQTRLQADSR